jgi:general L-amino acid transport system permease protein
MTSLSDQPHLRPPWWRNERILKVLLQVAFVVAVLLVFGILAQNLLASLRRLGISLGFRFLGNSANFGITEGLIPYDPSESYLKALAVGNEFLTLFKDTSLVFIVGLIDLLQAGRVVFTNPNWLGTQREVLFFIGLIYFICCFAMAYAAQQVEKALGLGKR